MTMLFEGTYNKGISIMDAFTQSFYIHIRLIFTISYELNSLVLDGSKAMWRGHNEVMER